MKKTTMLAAGMALLGGAMIGATSTPEPVQAAETRHVSDQAEKPSKPVTHKQAQQQDIVIKRYEWPDQVFARAEKQNPVRKSRNWSPTGSHSFNRIKHSKNTRRKHRRA